MNALGFLSDCDLDYGSRLSRLRWQRAVGCDPVELDARAPADAVLAGSDLWIVVREVSAIPLLASGRFPAPGRGRVLLAGTNLDLDPPFAHTLRELESATVRGRPDSADPARAPALAFRTGDLPPRTGESVAAFLTRLITTEGIHDEDPGFLAFSFDDPSERDRPEIVGLLGSEPARLLDVGCGRGGTAAAARARRPGTIATGIERDPTAAGRARERLDRVIEGDADIVLERLRSAGERFDEFLFADVLEHLSDPVEALRSARRLASSGARLVASVPNVGHLSLVRDLVLGRFDPVPAGLCDAGHLRWFTRSSLEEALGESGWRVDSVESLPGAPPPTPGTFREALKGWAVDGLSLATYQWVAVASPSRTYKPEDAAAALRKAGER